MPSYVEQLRDPRWQRKRLEVLSAAAWRCGRCQNSRRTLHVHHRKYRPVAVWEYESAELEVLCEPCHRQEHGFLRGTARFDETTAYSREAIKQVLGGNTTGFLPMHNGHVVYGCFRRNYNPDAPWIVLPGDLKRIVEPAERFCRQSFPIPIFLCDSDGDEWFYRGDYEVENWTENPVEIGIHNRLSNRNNILVSQHFYYFGGKAPALPPHLEAICHQTQGHRSDSNAAFVQPFIDWLDSLKLAPGQLYGWPDYIIDWGDVPGCGCRARKEDGEHDKPC